MNRLMEKISLNLKQVRRYYTEVGTKEPRSPKYSPLSFCPALEVTSLQFIPTPAIVLPIYSRMTATKPLELVVYSTVDINN